MKVEFEIPGSFPSVANLREHWRARQQRARRHRTDAAVLTALGVCTVPGLRALVQTNGGSVTMTRHAPRQLDSDNCASALKNARDGIALALGVDDGDPRVTWVYAQEKCRTGQERVRVVLEAAR